MTFRTMSLGKAFLLLAGLPLIGGLVGCGGSSYSNSGGTTTPPPAISVSVASSLSSVQVSATANVTATVLNDSANAGVTWTVSCGSTASGACGAVNPTSTASGTPTVYTAPAAVPTGNTVTITATSVTDTTKAASATVTITTTVSAAPLADGNYVFSLSGWDTGVASGNSGFPTPYFVSGVFTVAGGVITGGEQDFIDLYIIAGDAISPTGSSVSTDAAGNVLITLATGDSSLGVAGVETLSGAVLPQNAGRLLINEFDASASGSGELDLQDAAAALVTPAAGYAFEVSGLDGPTSFSGSGAGFPLGIGGVINIDGAGTISGNNSIFDANDDGSGATFQGEPLSASLVSTPDPLGRVTFTLNPTDTADFPQIILVGYIVDANHIRLVETSDTYGGTVGGTALSQGTNNGNFPTTLSGISYVAGLNGYDSVFVLQAAGLLNFNSSGSVSATADFNDLSVVEPSTPDSLTATAYTVDPTGRVTISNLTDGTNAFNLQLYLDGNGHAVAVSLDSTDVLTGLVYQQTGAPFSGSAGFSGAYAFNSTGWDFNEFGEFDAVGPVTATSTNTSFAGTLDLNWMLSAGPTYPSVAVSGTVGVAMTNGVLPGGSITGLDVTTCPTFGVGTGACTSDAFDYYLIDAAGDNVAIETDGNQLTLGTFLQQ